MKKALFIAMAVAATFALTGCKSKESNYKKAYEKAKAQEMTQTDNYQPVTVTPVVTDNSAATTTVTPVENTYNDRQERLTVVGNGALNTYNVVCGSFKSLDNANNLCNTLKNKGYTAQVAQNPETGMYRVIAASSADRISAVSNRDALRNTYPDAWILKTY